MLRTHAFARGVKKATLLDRVALIRNKKRNYRKFWKSFFGFKIITSIFFIRIGGLYTLPLQGFFGGV